MDARSLFAVLAIVFLLWLIRTWIKWDSHTRMARQSSQRLRDRVFNATLAARVGRRDTTALSALAATDSSSQSKGADADAGGAHEAADMAYLREQLEQSQRQAAAAEQNDLELRRLRGELESLQTERVDAAKRIEALELRIREQQAALDAADGRSFADNDASKQRQSEEKRDSSQGTSAGRPPRSDIADTDQATASSQGSPSTKSSAAAPENVPVQGNLAAMQESDEDWSSDRGVRHNTRKPEAKGFDQSAVKESGSLKAKGSQSAQTSHKIVTPLYQAPSEKDNLKQIKGIGPVMERTLNDLGVTTFQQLADFTQVDIDNVSEAIGAFPGRIERDDWVGNARQILRKRSLA